MPIYLPFSDDFQRSKIFYRLISAVLMDGFLKMKSNFDRGNYG